MEGKGKEADKLKEGKDREEERKERRDGTV